MPANEPSPPPGSDERRRRSRTEAYRLASECTSIAISMVVPGLMGWWFDAWVGCFPIVSVLGFTAGFVYGVWRLVRFGQRRSQRLREEKRRQHDSNPFEQLAQLDPLLAKPSWAEDSDPYPDPPASDAD